MKALSDAPEHKEKKQQLKKTLKELKCQVKPLKQFPRMLIKVLQKVSGPIKAEIQKAIEEVKNEHPKFKENYEPIVQRKR